MIRSAVLAAVSVLFAAAGAGVADPTDWALVLPHEVDCAKTQDTCEAARDAISKGWLVGVDRRTPTRCEPHPGCFSARSNCIAGFNCGDRR